MMIHIVRIEKPKELTDEVVKQKTELYKKDNTKTVWKEKYIQEALMAMSYHKCCYCECLLDEESKYMEIEHFHDKSSYPDEVVIWDNLLPSCKKCNTTKGTHDTKADPIINPAVDYPQKHMILYKGIRFRKKDKLGEMTITALNLNDQERHCMPRYKLMTEVTQKIENFYETSEEYLSGQKTQTPQGLGRLRNNVLSLLSLGKKEKEYSSIVATAIMNDPYYAKLESNMKKLNSWNQDMTDVAKELFEIKYDEQ